MSAFEFYLAFYGLLLGLSVAEVASGFLNVLGARQNAKIGLLTPSLGHFLRHHHVLGLRWGIRDSVTVNLATMFGGLLVALIYNLVAGLLFPRQIAEWPDLREHYWRYKRFITGGILVANVFTSTVTLRNFRIAPAARRRARPSGCS